MLPPEWFWKAATVLIASWAAWSGWQQHRIARDKLRLDLFEKRLAVFEEIKHAITAAHDRSEVDLPRFQRAAAASTFLFGSEIHSYMREVQQKLKEVKTKSFTLASSSDISSGGRSIRSDIRCASASTISAGINPNESSRGTSNGSLNRVGELHLSARLLSTMPAVSAGVYLTKL